MKILVLAGDGIGPEISQATLTVLERANVLYKLGLEWQHDEIGFVTLKKEGTTLPPRVMDAARAAAGVLLGPVSHLDYPDRDQGGVNPSGEMRTKLDLYANIRPAKSRLGVGLTGKPVDLIIFRECTEGFYADRNVESGNSEILVTPDVAISLRRITRECCERIARSAFQLAMQRRKHLTLVHKHNVLKITDGIFLDACHRVAVEFPDVKVDDVIVDAMMAHVVRAPDRFDVIVTTNMFGDILSDLTAELSGSLGLGGSLNAGLHNAMGQAAHGSAPDIAGKGVANPLATILSAAMMLRYSLDQAAQADRIEQAVRRVLQQGLRTADIYEPGTTKVGTVAMGDAVLKALG
jgi:3-isopropylmalate dehydrogenase